MESPFGEQVHAEAARKKEVFATIDKWNILISNGFNSI